MSACVGHCLEARASLLVLPRRCLSLSLPHTHTLSRPVSCLPGSAETITLVTGPRRSLSLKLSDTRVYEPQIRANWNQPSTICSTLYTPHPTPSTINPTPHTVKAMGAMTLLPICDSSFTCDNYNTYRAHPWSPFPLRRAHPGPGPHTHPASREEL